MQGHQLKRSESSTFDLHNNINLPHGSFVNQTTPYWPDLPAVLTVPVATNQSSHVVDVTNISQVLKEDDNAGRHQASIKNLLIKLGGRFSETASTDHQFHNSINYPADQLSAVQDQAYSFDILSTYGAVGPTMYQGLENLQSELRELIYSNHPQQAVLLDGIGTNNSDGFCGIMEQMFTGSTTTTAATTGTSTTSVDSGSWGEMNSSSLVFATNMVSDYGNYQLPHQDSAFEESRYFETSTPAM